MMKAEPQKEHRWLENLVGSWTVTSEMPTGAGEAAAHAEWIERVRSLHGMWVVAEGKGEMPGGGAATTMMTLGYDPRRQSYVGTWVGSMMTHLWVYEGTLDESGTVLTLDCEGPDFEAEGKLARYQDIITIQDEDHRTLTARVQTADGTWKQIMSAQYRRKK
jgi:hypothetical protein